MSRGKRSAVYRNVERTILSIEILGRAAAMAPSDSPEELALHEQLLRANGQLQLACVEAARSYREGSGGELFADLAAMTLGSLIEFYAHTLSEHPARHVIARTQARTSAQQLLSTALLLADADTPAPSGGA